MKLNLINTSQGLIPCYDEDFDEKKKLKLNEVYECSVKLFRNYEFHKKYFKMIDCAWEYQNEAVTAFFKNKKELFRESVEISAGNYEQFYDINRKAWLERKKSISFDKMSASEFNDLYESVKNVLFSVFLKDVSVDDFNKNLINF